MKYSLVLASHCPCQAHWIRKIQLRRLSCQGWIPRPLTFYTCKCPTYQWVLSNPNYVWVCSFENQKCIFLVKQYSRLRKGSQITHQSSFGVSSAWLDYQLGTVLLLSLKLSLAIAWEETRGQTENRGGEILCVKGSWLIMGRMLK